MTSTDDLNFLTTRMTLRLRASLRASSAKAKTFSDWGKKKKSKNDRNQWHSPICVKRFLTFLTFLTFLNFFWGARTYLLTDLLTYKSCRYTVKRRTFHKEGRISRGMFGLHGFPKVLKVLLGPAMPYDSRPDKCPSLLPPPKWHYSHFKGGAELLPLWYPMSYAPGKQ